MMQAFPWEVQSYSSSQEIIFFYEMTMRSQYLLSCEEITHLLWNTNIHNSSQQKW